MRAQRNKQPYKSIDSSLYHFELPKIKQHLSTITAMDYTIEPVAGEIRNKVFSKFQKISGLDPGNETLSKLSSIN